MATGTTMTVARHGFVPARTTADIVLAPTICTVETSMDGTLLLTAGGVAYLPGSVGGVFLESATESAKSVYGVGEAVTSAVKAVSDRRQADAAQPIGVSASVQAALQKRNAFAAGYADVVSVGYKSRLTSKIWVDLSGSSGTDNHQILLVGSKKVGGPEQLATMIAVRRVLVEGAWVMQEALARLRSEPAPQRPLAETIDVTDAVLNALRELIDGAGLTREEVADCALQQHPEFAEFESVPAVAKVYSALIKG
jgi:hypothetical protein